MAAREKGARRAAPLGTEGSAHRTSRTRRVQQGSRRLSEAADLGKQKLFLVLAGLLLAGAVLGQPYPAKPVRWIVPTGPGSAVDVTARRIAPKLAEALGQPVIVDNRPGASSMIGAREVRARRPTATRCSRQW